MHRNFRGLRAAITCAVLLSAVYGCSGTTIKDDPALYLLDLPINIDNSVLTQAIDNDTDISASVADTGQMDAAPDISSLIPASVIARGARIRQSPGTAGASLGKVRRGADLMVAEIREDGWCLVETSDGVSGYVWAPLLRIKGSKFKTAMYRGKRYLLVSGNTYLGPGGDKKSKLQVEGLHFRRPLSVVRITSRFGVRKTHPVNGGRNKMHQGVDMKASVGTPVKASAGGIVKSIKRGPNYGIYVDIKHKLGFTTRYAHLSRALVKKGQRVKAGQLIARSGNTGATTGPHLHFELHRKGNALNPLRYITSKL